MVPRVTLYVFGENKNFQPLSGIESTVHCTDTKFDLNPFVIFDCDILHLLRSYEREFPFAGQFRTRCAKMYSQLR